MASCEHFVFDQKNKNRARDDQKLKLNLPTLSEHFCEDGFNSILMHFRVLSSLIKSKYHGLNPKFKEYNH